MKLKYYLRGIGVGVIATTLILTVVFALHKKDMITDEEIIARASQLGMVMAEDLSASEKLADQNERADDANDLEPDVMQPDEPLDMPEEDLVQPDTDEPDIDASDEEEQQITVAPDTEDDAEEETDEPDESHTTIEQVEFTIVGGEYSDTVCKKLKEAGLIEDEKDFNKYLAKGGYDSLIQPGNYVIPKGAEYKEIVSIITERRSQTGATNKKS